MFHVRSSPFGPLERTELTNPETGALTAVLPGRGGAVHELRLTRGGAVHAVLAAEKDPETFLSAGGSAGAKLVPWPNRIRNGEYTFRGRKYQLELNEGSRRNALHGLLVTQEMSVMGHRSDEDGCSVILVCRLGKDPGYPFPLLVELTYSLTPAGFSCETVARNAGDEPLPFADGWHPYFTLEKPIDALTLDISASRMAVFDRQMIPMGERGFEFDGLLKGKTFDDCLTLTRGETSLIDQETGLRLVLWQDRNYPYLQVYTPPERKSIALEPMSALPDAFRSGQGLRILKPGEEFRGRYGVRLE